MFFMGENDLVPGWIEYNELHQAMLIWEEPMAKKTITVDIAGALEYPFQDQEWLKKLVVAGLLIFISFIPVIPVVLLLGYLGKIIQGIVIDRQKPSLPEWDNLSDYFQSGFRLFGAGIVYMLPAGVLITLGYVGMMIPVFLIELGGMSESEAFWYMIIGYLAGFGLMGIGTLISMITGLILPIAGTHVAVNEDFSAAFRFIQVWEIFKANWSGFLVSFLILIGASMILYYASYFLVITVVLCCLYPFVISGISAYLGFVGAALFGEAYRLGLDRIS